MGALAAVLELSGTEAVLAVGALATGAAWLVAAGVVYLVRRPPEPAVGPRTLDLGSEPPAVANFLVNDWRVTSEAVPATLLDLAARNVVEVEQRGPGVFYVRLRSAPSGALTAYDRRVLEHLDRHASDGVVPAEALTTGPAEESKRWKSAFATEVVADAKARGLSRDALDGKKTVFEEISGGDEVIKLGSREVPSRDYVSWFNFKGPDQQKKVGQLSGGERNRVHLAKMLKSGANLILLDEPTNDLDVETLSSLEAALEDFPGCAVIISHDRFFLDRIATHILSFEGDSHVEWFEGNFQDYEEDKKRRLGVDAEIPHRIKYKKFTR